MSIHTFHGARRPARWLMLAFAVGAFGLLVAAPVARGDEKPADQPGREAVIAVKGVACPFCVYGLEKHLKKLPGARRTRVELGKGEAVVDFAGDAKITDEQLRKAVRDAGFSAGPIEWRGDLRRGDAPEAPKK